MVIRDDLRCKNCRTVNQFQLTPKSVSQISAESIKVLAFTRAGLKIPEHYPVKHIQWRTKEDKVVTLQDSEREHLEAVDNFPTKPAVHLALGKFYEYVKQDREARKAYLRALDLDTHSVESMAGLARLEHAAGQLKAANEWIESCYANLEKGHYYLADDQAAFKKAVREAHREYARELGAKPKEAPVEIRFHLDVAEHPKNKPCPCGSGKKYKLCCMPGKKDG
jgi:tetratricopeptide (TPR) repeat protein